MPTAYSYTRFSTIGQRHGASEARQGESALPWCLANGYTLDTTLKPDKGKSGFKGMHLKEGAALHRFLEMIESGAIAPGSCLLIEHIDRLSRLPWQRGFQIVKSILDKDVDIVTILDNQKYTKDRLANDLGCIFLLMMQLCTANEQSGTKSKRSKDVWERHRKTGHILGARPAWIAKDMSVIEERANIVRRIFAMAAEGFGSRSIVRTLNSEGIPPIGKAKVWSRGTVQHYLSSRTVLGELQYAVDRVNYGDPVIGYYTPIVEPSVFAMANRRMQDRKRHNIKGRVSECPNLFVGMLKNMYDNQTFIHKGQRRKDKKTGKVRLSRKLFPYGSELGVKNGMNVLLNYLEFESAFFRFVKEIDVASLFATGKGEKTRELVEKKESLIEIEGRLRLVKERFKTSKNKSVLLDMIEDAETERKAIVSEIENLSADLTTSETIIFADLLKILEDPTARVKIASTLRMLIEGIDVLPVHTGVAIYNRTQYLLFVRVRFHNGQERFYITDNEGSDRSDVVKTVTETSPITVQVPRIEGLAYESQLFTMIHACIKLASPIWKDRLLDWISILYDRKLVTPKIGNEK